MRRYLCRWEDQRGQRHNAVFTAEGIRRTMLAGHADGHLPDMSVFALGRDPGTQPVPVLMNYDHVFSRVCILDLKGRKIDFAGLPIRGRVYWPKA